MTDKITDLGDARFHRDMEKLGKENSALAAGYQPAEELADWYLKGGYHYDCMLHAMAYSAAAQLFRDMTPQEAEGLVRETFESIVRELLRYGPHYGHEPY